MFRISTVLIMLGNLLAYATTSITGAGSSFVAPVMYKWSFGYYQQNSTEINYQSIGSGAGVRQVEEKTIHFGTSDMPLSDKQLEQKGLVQFPIVVGGILMVTNIAGVRPGELILDGNIIAQIYSGLIQKWNDPKILALNPQLHLPDQTITVVYRSDGAGTTYNFTDFMQKSAANIWKNGTGTSVSWPSNIVGVGGKGNEGVTSLVKQTSGSIGYLEFSYATSSEKLAWARMKNASGDIVPEITSADLAKPQRVNALFKSAFEAVLVDLDWTKNKGMSVNLINSSNKNAWPMTACGYVLIQKTQENPQLTKQMLNFFHYAYTTGAKDANSLSYVSLPAKAIQVIDEKWKNEINYVVQ